MRFFIGLYTNWMNEWPVIEEVVLAADRLGFEGVLMPDHYMFSEKVMGIRPDRNATLESWVALAVLASRTEQVRLGTLVSPIPLRPPGLLAKMVTTVDVLSKGRVVLGVGAGWSWEWGPGGQMSNLKDIVSGICRKFESIRSKRV